MLSNLFKLSSNLYPQLRPANIIASIVFIIAIIASLWFMPQEIIGSLLITIVLFIFNICYLLFLYPTLFTKSEHFASFAALILYITPIFTFLHFTGGINSPFFYFLFFMVMGTALSVGSLGGFIAIVFIIIFLIISNFVGAPQTAVSNNTSYKIFSQILFLALAAPFAAMTAQRYIKIRTQRNQINTLASKLQDANIQIQSVDKMKSDLLNMASHEFRTPLSAIKTAVWFLNKDEERSNLSEKANTNLDRIIKSTDRLIALQDHLSQMLQATTGELTLDLESVQIEKIIQEAIQSKQVEAEEEQIDLVQEESDQLLPLTLADPTKLKYVFWELITNALKYTDPKGIVNLKSWQEEDIIKVAITDTGHGIPKEKQKQLFKGFDKIDYFHTTQPGFGLGLYIIKQIVDLHEGNIKVESEIDKGSTITISLPIKHPTQTASDSNID